VKLETPSKTLVPLVSALLAVGLLAAPMRALAQTLAPPTLIEAEQPVLPESVHLDQAAAVVLEVTVDVDGHVKDPVLLSSSGNADVDALAILSLERVRFAPATRDGVAIAARIPFRIDFAASPPPPPVPTPAPVPAAAPPVPAEPPPPAQAIVLSVRGERPPREVTAHTVTVQEIRTLPGTNGDPLRAVEAMPGVARPPGLQGELIVRGSAPQDSITFIDGIAVPYAYHLGGIASVVPADALEKLDFRPGNFGPEYGRAMGGVVELGLRAPNKERYSGVLQLDNIDARFLVQGPLGKRARFMLAGRRSWMDAWMGGIVGGNDVAFKALPVYWDGQLALEVDLTRRTTATLFAFGADDKLELLIKTPDAQDPGEGGKIGVHTGFLRFGLRTRTEISDALTWTNTLSWGPDRSNLVFGVDRFDFTVQQIAGRSELRARFHERVSGAFGLDAQFSRYDLDLNVRPYPPTDEVESPYFARPARRFVEKIWMVRPAAYAQIEITPWHGTRLIPSLRVDYTDDTGDVTVDPRFVFRSIVHEGTYRTTLKGGVGLYQQPPLPQESASPFGTPGVRSNRSIHSSLGVEQQLYEDLSLSLEGFYKHYSRLIIATPDEGESAIGARFENIGTGRSYGGEAMLKYQGNHRFSGWLAYTLSRSERKNGKDDRMHLFQYDQTHILSLLGNVKLWWGMSFGGRFRYVTGSPNTPIVGGILDLDAGAYGPIPGASFSQRLPAFHQLDLRLDKTWQIRKGALVAYVEVRNVYNQKNTEEIVHRYDYAAAQKQSGLPILPVIGLRGEL
jgi:TonB family protein